MWAMKATICLLCAALLVLGVVTLAMLHDGHGGDWTGADWGLSVLLLGGLAGLAVYVCNAARLAYGMLTEPPLGHHE